MRKSIIIGNWKMNNTIIQTKKLCEELINSLKNNNSVNVEIAVAPPYTALSQAALILQNSKISLCAQNVSWEDSGAFTGEISAPMLKEIGVSHVIIGHSERRNLFYETDNLINKKIKASIKHELIPIFCIGETQAEYGSKQTEETIIRQFTKGLLNISNKEIEKIIIAYEPVWAIGTGITATPQQAEKIHALIRQLLIKQYDNKTSEKVRILYGGSVNAKNSKDFFVCKNIDGVLVGGASLKSDSFVEIIKSG